MVSGAIIFDEIAASPPPPSHPPPPPPPLCGRATALFATAIGQNEFSFTSRIFCANERGVV